jgi:hypothetical protein
VWLLFVTIYYIGVHKGKNQGIASDSRHIVGRGKADGTSLAQFWVHLIDPAKVTRDYPLRDLRKEMFSMPSIGEIVVRMQSGSKK